MAERHTNVEQLMRDIDEKIGKFCAITGASGKVVKKRWRNIKNSSPATLPKHTDDKLDELEKAIRNHYIRKGYKVGDGAWEFQVTVISQYLNKHILILLDDDSEEEAQEIYQAEASTLDALYTDALGYFNAGKEHGNL